jgi:hypothetical protein
MSRPSGELFARAEAVRQGVRSVLEGRYGKQGTELLKYGFVPAQPTTNKTAASKAAAATKAKETRARLGTKGSKQKEAAIKAADTAPAPQPATPAPIAPSGPFKGS